jgi:hypothetical protein
MLVLAGTTDALERWEHASALQALKRKRAGWLAKPGGAWLWSMRVLAVEQQARPSPCPPPSRAPFPAQHPV